MTDTQRPPEQELADTLGDLSHQTTALVRREIESAKREMVEGAKHTLPVVAMFAGAGLLGVLALSSTHRFVLGLLERRLSPATASLFAMSGYGLAAAAAGLAAWGRRDEIKLIVPTETARKTAEGVRAAAAEA